MAWRVQFPPVVHLLSEGGHRRMLDVLGDMGPGALPFHLQSAVAIAFFRSVAMSGDGDVPVQQCFVA